MIETKETVFVDRFDYKYTNSLLNEILRKTEMITHLKGSYPKYVKMKINSYYEILNYNSSLIKKVDKDYYILGMKIIL